MTELKQIDNLPELLKWRKEVITNVFDEVPSAELMEVNRMFYQRHLADHTHLAFIALEDGVGAGCGALCLSEELPSPDNPSGKCGYLMNIYVRDEFRDRGIGHEIVRRLVNEAKIRNCGKIYLETTEAGRKLYESLGFHDLPDMMKLANDK